MRGACGSCDRDAWQVRASSGGQGAAVAPDRLSARAGEPRAAATVTWRMNHWPINGLADACAGYPQACQQNLWVSAATIASHIIGASTWHRDAKCGEPARVTARRAPRLHHACQSPSDQRLSVAVRRISTSLPTFSVEKSAWRSRGAAHRANRLVCRIHREDVEEHDGLRVDAELLPDREVRVHRFEMWHWAPLQVVRRRLGGKGSVRDVASRRAPARRGLAHSLRTSAKPFRINGLLPLAAGCPQACQHNLWKSGPSGVCQAGAGKRTVTVSPRPPCVVPSATVARCCSAIRLTIDSPSPLPDDVTACAPSPR